MTANEGEKFRGDKIVIFYDHDFGAIPYYDKKNNSYRFGGIPQVRILPACSSGQVVSGFLLYFHFCDFHGESKEAAPIGNEVL